MLLLFIEIILILLNFTLIAIVYKGQSTLVSKLRLLEASFISFVASMSVFIIIQSLYDYVTRPEQIQAMQRLLDVGLSTTLLMVISFWVFMSQVVKQKISRQKFGLHISIAISIILAGYIYKPVSAAVEGGTLTFAFKPFLYAIYTAYLLAYFGAGLRYIISKKYWQKSKLLNHSRKRLITGFILALIMIVFGNVVLPMIYSQTSDAFMNSAGNAFLALGVTLLSFSSAFSVFNLGVFNLRKFLTHTIVAAVAYIVPTLLLVVIISALQNTTVQLLNINETSIASKLIMSFYLLATIMIVINTKKFVDRIMSKFYDAREFSSLIFSQKVENLIRNVVSEGLLNQYAKLLKNELGIEKVLVYVRGSVGTDLEEFQAISEVTLGGQASVEKATLLSEVNRIKKYSTYAIMDFADIKSDETGYISSYSYVLQYKQNQMEGFILLGSKLDGKNFYIDELIAIRKSFIEIELAMQNVFQINKLIAFNLSLESKIEDATKQLRRTNEKLKALDDAKDEFISMASHQLRTPLTSIKGYISLILDGDMGKIPAKQRKMLTEAFSSSQRMVYLISDLLNVSRLKTGKFLIEPADIYLPDVVEEEIEQVKEMAEVKDIKINYVKPKDFTHIMLDDMKIRQVIMNFVDNAIHYTPAGGEIDVHISDEGKSIEFKVIDSGIGVPKSEQHHLFTKFYRAGNARKARPDGTGLGLFMAKKVIVASGGSIIFSSEEGKGSTFGFIFPKS